jgi:signal peptidase I
MGYYFPIILLLLTIFTGVCFVFYYLIPKAKRAELKGYYPFKFLSFARDFFWVFLVVLLIRTWVASLYSVPTGSLEPTVIQGDTLLTTKYNYGLYAPVWDKKLIKTSEPKRGDIILFHDPVHPKSTLIKRLIGLPGDHISFINKVLYINGKEMKQTPVTESTDVVLGHKIPAEIMQENLDGLKHQIFIDPSIPAQDFYNLVVPKGHYFAMGDNRDFSDDSRFWGFVPANNIFAKAHFVLVNFKHFKRVGTSV